MPGMGFKYKEKTLTSIFVAMKCNNPNAVRKNTNINIVSNISYKAPWEHRT